MASSSSATVAVEKATSDLLISPDWTMNIEICDSINSSQWQAKDVIRAVKKRLQHKNPKVQFLSLTLLETMVKNCGDYVHFQIADRNILEEMVKIVKKKADMQVRDKILVLLDSWQEAFGGPGGKYPQYYWTFEELRRSGVVFPNRSSDAAPIFTPPITNQTTSLQPGYGMPTNSSRRLDETMTNGIDSLSSSSLDAIRDVADLLTDMLQAVNPGDSAAIKDEVIDDLVQRCRTNQKKLMQMLTTTGEEELLARGLELNDHIQSLLAKHDALTSGSPLPNEGANFNIPLSEASSSTSHLTEGKISGSEISGPASIAGIPSETRNQLEEEEDEFAQLARRHSKPQSSTDGGISKEIESVSVSVSNPSNALTLADPPAPLKITKEQDLIDLLSLNLSMTTVSSDSHQQTSNQNTHQVPVSPSTQGNFLLSQTNFGNQEHERYDSYVVPWAQTKTPLASQLQYETLQQSYPQYQPLGQQQFHHHPRSQMPQSQQELQVQHQSHFGRTQGVQPAQAQQFQPQSTFQGQHLTNHLSAQHHAASSAQFRVQESGQTQGTPQGLETRLRHQQQLEYPQSQLHNQYHPRPRCAATPVLPCNHNDLSPTNASRTEQANNSAGYTSIQSSSSLHGRPTPSPSSQTAQKPFVPSYRLFEDLNVFGNADGKQKMTASGSSSGLSESMMGPGMMGGRK